METRLRYSAEVCYNNFPVEPLSTSDRDRICTAALSVLSQRERYPELNIEKLYDPDLMPQGLKEAHDSLDCVVDSVLFRKVIRDDNSVVALLLKKYSEMTGDQNA